MLCSSLRGAGRYVETEVLGECERTEIVFRSVAAKR